MIDDQVYYRKLAAQQNFSEDEIVSLLKELECFRNAAAYLASCHAATLEGLPKSASKRQQQRHRDICQTAAKILQGDKFAIRHVTTVSAAVERCLAAENNFHPIQS